MASVPVFLPSIGRIPGVRLDDLNPLKPGREQILVKRLALRTKTCQATYCTS